MSELKTQPTEASVVEFLAAVEHPQRRADAEAVCAMLTELTAEAPVMWGDSMVGFGGYTYVNSTKKPARWPIIGFSPRKANLTVYIMPGFAEQAALLGRLGKVKTSVSCLYITRLAAIDQAALRELCAWSIATMRARYPAG